MLSVTLNRRFKRLARLAEGFNYRVLSQLGDLMNDGTPVPDKGGMGCFQGENGELILVRNHELRPDDDYGSQIAEGFDTAIAACSIPRTSCWIAIPGGETSV